MKFSISEIFCEVVSAFGFVGAFLPGLVLLDFVTVGDIADWVKSLTGTYLLSFVFIAYILGVFLNIVGLPADRLLDRLGITGPDTPESSRKRFYQQASSDLWDFRTNTWNHYYCFRNLLAFCPFAFFLWIPVIWIHSGFPAAAMFAIIFLPIVWLLYLAVKEHADFYSNVTRAFDGV